jgi:hypothetical protein
MLLALICIAIVSLPGCERRATESAELVASLRAENEALRRQSISLLGENAALRAQLMGQPAWQSSAQLRRIGGTGGVTPYARICSRGQALLGFYGRAGGVIDALAPVCSPLDSALLTTADGSLAPVETALEPLGGPGGADFDRLCDAGSHVVGIRGRAGANVDALELVCGRTSGAAPPDDARPSRRRSDSAVLPPVGGSGGLPFDRSCPEGWVVMGVSGRYGRFIDSLTVHCGPVGEPSELQEGATAP